MITFICQIVTFVELRNEENSIANAIKEAPYKYHVKNTTSNELRGKMLRNFNKREQTMRAGVIIKSDTNNHVSQ